MVLREPSEIAKIIVGEASKTNSSGINDITIVMTIGTYFGHMVIISDLGACPQSRLLPLVKL